MLSWALVGVGGKQYDPAACTPGKSRGTRCTGGWVGPQYRFGQVWSRNKFPLPGFELRTIQLLASLCTDYATGLAEMACFYLNLKYRAV